MDQLSQALNRGAQPMPVAENMVSMLTVSIDLRDLGGQPGAVQKHVRGGSRLYASPCAAAQTYQIHTGRRLPFVHFAWKTRSIVRKKYFFVRLRPFWTINKPKTNILWERLTADRMMTSLANIKLCADGLVGVHAPIFRTRR